MIKSKLLWFHKDRIICPHGSHAASTQRQKGGHSSGRYLCFILVTILRCFPNRNDVEERVIFFLKGSRR